MAFNSSNGRSHSNGASNGHSATATRRTPGRQPARAAVAAIEQQVRRRPRMRFDRRGSGLLMHLTSLPSPHGSGDLGLEAFQFVDFLAEAGQRWWQMLPVTPPGPGGAPYSSCSSFAGSPWLLSLDKLHEQGLLADEDVERGFPPGKRINFNRVGRYRESRLRLAFDRFKKRAELHGEFGTFCQSERSWLDDFSLYSAIKQSSGGAAWLQWERGLRLREPAAMTRARRELAEEIRFHQFVQFEFHRQWDALREYATQRGVGLIGDVPIFVAHDSADVWAHRELFQLSRGGAPIAVTGVPPDCFNADGQLWGHPQYDWDEHQRQGFDWWIARFGAAFRLFDAMRIDHFLGFARCWAIGAKQTSARRGKWIQVPGAEIFQALRRRLGNMPIIAEDLGLLTPQAQQLRDQFRFPGMRVVQWAFGDDEYHRPYVYPRRSVAYTGTHDNDTIAGWFQSLRSGSKRGQHSAMQQRVLEYTGSSGREIHWDMIRLIMSSPADTAVFPVQDVLGLGNEARMNLPGTAQGNWSWRLLPGQLTRAHAKRLRRMSELYGRT